MTRPGPLVLAVDDDEPNLALLRDVCEVSGWHVETAIDAEQALKIAARCRPDVILMDLMMPGQSGIEVLEMLQHQEDTALVPVVFVTASSDSAAEEQAYQVGAVDYVTKPFHVFDLQARVQVAIDLASYRPGRTPGHAALDPAVLLGHFGVLRTSAPGAQVGVILASCQDFEGRRQAEPLATFLALMEAVRRLRRGLAKHDGLHVSGGGELVVLVQSTGGAQLAERTRQLAEHLAVEPAEPRAALPLRLASEPLPDPALPDAAGVTLGVLAKLRQSVREQPARP